MTIRFVVDLGREGSSVVSCADSARQSPRIVQPAGPVTPTCGPRLWTAPVRWRDVVDIDESVADRNGRGPTNRCADERGGTRQVVGESLFVTRCAVSCPVTESVTEGNDECARRSDRALLGAACCRCACHAGGSPFAWCAGTAPPSRPAGCSRNPRPAAALRRSLRDRLGPVRSPRRRLGLGRTIRAGSVSSAPRPVGARDGGHPRRCRAADEVRPGSGCRPGPCHAPPADDRAAPHAVCRRQSRCVPRRLGPHRTGLERGGSEAARVAPQAPLSPCRPG